MSGAAKASEADRANGGRAIVRSLICASLIASAAAVYEYVLSFNLESPATASQVNVFQGFLVFIAIVLIALVISIWRGYLSRSSSTLSVVFIGLSAFLLTMFGYALFVAGTPEVVIRHTGWMIAILIIPFLTLDRPLARLLGAALCAGNAGLVVLHIIFSGANPLTDPGYADLIIFLFSLAAAYLLLDGFAMFREAAIKFHARSDVLEQTAASMQKAVETAEAAKREAEKSIKLRETFLATMSHELRTPLNAIIGFSEVIKSDALGDRAIDQYRSYASDIHQSGEHVLGLINQLLDYSRIQSGTFDLTIAPVCIESVAAQVHRMMLPMAERKAIHLKMECSADKVPLVLADRQGLVQIAINLVGNAIKFTPAGGAVRLQINTTQSGFGTLIVSDNGPGIPPEKLDDVQKPFVRLGDASLASETGTGLGLAIVTTLASAMDASFSVTSEPGRGTCCSVRLNAAPIIEAASY